MARASPSPSPVTSDDVQTPRSSVFRWPVYWLTLVGHWPREPHSRIAYFFSRVVWPVGWTYIAVHIILYLIMDEYTLIECLHSFCDLFIIFLMLAKMYTLNRHGLKLFEIRRLIEHAFEPFETEISDTSEELNSACSRHADTLCVTVFWSYVILASASATVSFGTVLGPREQREFWFQIPNGWQEIDIVYWLLFFFMYPFNYSIFNIFPSSFDMLFVSISLHLSCKAKILKLLLSKAASRGKCIMPTANQMEDVENKNELPHKLKQCVKYQNLIIRLWSESEHVLSGCALVQVMYNLTVVGVPLVRFLFEDLAIHEIVFVGLYTSFNLAQLFMFCWYGDMVAHATSQVCFAAYGVYSPDILFNSESKAVLHMMMVRSQKPLYFTVYKFSNMTRKLYIQILKRSQGFYSAVVSMR